MGEKPKWLPLTFARAWGYRAWAPVGGGGAVSKSCWGMQGMKEGNGSMPGGLQRGWIAGTRAVPLGGGGVHDAPIHNHVHSWSWAGALRPYVVQ